MLNNEIRNVLEKYGKQMVMAVQDKLMRDNTNATGDAINSLTHEATENTLTIMGNRYIEAIDQGRGAGKRMPPVVNILQWIKAKGIRQTSSSKRLMRDKDLAWVIARKIAREGTLKRFGNQGTNLLGYVTNQYAEPITNEIADLIIKQPLDANKS
tara:strand:- start:228 stop:692 length:465 start_codon:yes stop_codon:yes gene_type:complete